MHVGAIDRSRSKKQELKLELELDAIASIDVFSVWIAVRAGRLIRQPIVIARRCHRIARVLVY